MLNYFWSLSDKNIGVIGLLIGIAGLVLAVVSICYAYYTNRKMQRSKLVTYCVGDPYVLAKIFDRNPKIHVSAYGVEAEVVYRNKLLVWNRGIDTIERSDITKQMKVTWETSSPVLFAGIDSKDPGVSVDVKLETESINVPIDIMRAGEAFIIDIDSADQPAQLSVDFDLKHINAVKSETAGDILNHPKTIGVACSILFIPLSFSILISVFKLYSDQPDNQKLIAIAGSFIITLSVIPVGIFVSWLLKKRFSRTAKRFFDEEDKSVGRMFR